MEKYQNALVIDDDPVSNFICNLLLCRQKIAQKVYLTQTVDSAFEVLDELQDVDGRPNLILLDIKMPDKNGFEFMETFNKRYLLKKERTEIGILTNSNSSEDLQKMLSLGANYWINKPLKKEIIVSLTEAEVG